MTSSSDGAAISASGAPWQDAVLEVGGRDQAAEVHHLAPSADTSSGSNVAEEQWKALLTESAHKISTLLKTESLSFLLGAGASVAAGGILLGAVPLPIESELIERGLTKSGAQPWLRLFYAATRQALNIADGAPRSDDDILARSKNIESVEPIRANYEAVLTLLWRWRSALARPGDVLTIKASPSIETTAEIVQTAIDETTEALARHSLLPTPDSSIGTAVHQEFLKKVLTRPTGLRRATIFTLNYDTLIEQAADAQGVVLLDGFVGSHTRIFRPEAYDQDLYFPAETTERRVTRLERVIHLYKLHGSLNWRADSPTWDNPFGVSIEESRQAARRPLIYPTPAKLGESLGMPYAELFRRFAAAIVRSQSTLFVIGYGFGDDHVNAIVRQALATPSFSLVIVDPKVPPPDKEGGFVARLRSQNDRRVWIISGSQLGTFSGFVQYLLPDLRDEQILQAVMETYQSLAPRPVEGQPDAD